MAVRITAPAAVAKFVCCAMVTKITIGAPPGTMMNGSRAPKPPGPKLCNSVPRPQIRKVALMRLSVRAGLKCSARLTRKAAVIGEAAMTRTCCRPKINSCGNGRISSTGWTLPASMAASPLCTLYRVSDAGRGRAGRVRLAGVRKPSRNEPAVGSARRWCAGYGYLADTGLARWWPCSALTEPMRWFLARAGLQ